MVIDNSKTLKHSISIVTAVRNMEDTVSQTLQSVVSQKSINDQYIVIDAASTDRTIEIVKSFGDGIDVFISEPDDGQYYAIAKGFSKATGDIMGWINADDILMPWTFSVIKEIFAQFPDVHWITGLPSWINKKSQFTRISSNVPAYPRKFIANGWFQPGLGGYLQQESMFWRRSLFEQVGGLDLSFQLAADFELWTRFANHVDLIPIEVPLGAFRSLPGQQRSSVGIIQYEKEVSLVCSQKRAPPRLWSWCAKHSAITMNIARFMISARHPVIRYNHRLEEWQKITRFRCISQNTLGVLEDARRMRPPRN